jgi:hypothetical protein
VLVSPRSPQYYVGKVPLPVITSVSPKYVCLSQQARELTVDGSGFYTYNELFGSVKVGDGDGDAASFSPADAGVDLGIWRQDVLVHKSVKASVKKANVTELAKSTVTVLQPVPVVDSAHFASQVPLYVEKGCTASADVILVPPPTVSFVQPRLMCLGSSQTVVIGGKNLVFVVAAGAAPAAATTTAAAAATTAAATTAAETTVPAPAPTIMSRKRQNNDSTTTAAPSTEAPTTVAADAPPVTLATVGTKSVATGAGAAKLGAGAATAVTGTECAESPLSADLQVCSQATLKIDVTSSGVASGKFAPFVLTQPDPIGCESAPFEVAIIEPTKIDTVTPMLIFAENFEVPVKLAGSGFLRLDGKTPTVFFQETAVRTKNDSVAVPRTGTPLLEITDVTLSDCAPVAGVAGAEACKELRFVVPRGNAFPDKVLDLVVMPPPPLDFMCGASRQTALLKSVKVDAPTTPYLTCAAEGSDVTLDGSFIDIAGTAVVKFNGVRLAPTGKQTVRVSLDINNIAVKLYDKLEFTVTPAVLGETPLQAVTTNAFIDLEETFAGLFQPNLAPTNSAVTFIPNMQTTAPVFPGLCGTSTVQFSGDWFIRYGNTAALTDSVVVELVTPGGDVMTSPTNLTPTMSDCSPAGLAGYPQYFKCRTVTVNVPTGTVGTLQLRGRNVLSKCALRVAQPVATVTASDLRLTSVSPPSICIGSGNQNLTLVGTFPQIGTALPNVALNGIAFGGGSCVRPGTTPNTCAEMFLPIDAIVAETNANVLQGAISAVVRVSACSSPSVNMTSGRPTGAALRLSPDRICGTQNALLDVFGSSIIPQMDEVALELLVANKPPLKVTLNTVTNCTGASPNQVCQQARALLQGRDLMPLLQGDNTEVKASYVLITSNTCRQVAIEPPRVLTLVPQPFVNTNNDGVRLAAATGTASTFATKTGCFDQALTLTITGMRFVQSGQLRVELRNPAAPTAAPIVLTPLLSDVTPGSVRVDIARGAVPVGTYNVVVVNGGACESVPQQINIDPEVRVVTTEPTALPLSLVADFPLKVRTVGVLRASQLVISAPNAQFGAPTLEDGVVQVFFNSTPVVGTYALTARTDALCTGSSAGPIFEILPASAAINITADSTFLTEDGELVLRPPSGQRFQIGTRIYVRRSASVVEELDEMHLIEGGAAVRGIDKKGGETALDFFVVDPTRRVWGQIKITKTTNNNAGNVVLPATLVAGTAGTVSVTVRTISQGETKSANACELLCMKLDNTVRAEACTIGAIAPSGAGDLVGVSFPGASLVAGEVCRVRFVTLANNAKELPAQVTSQRIAVIPPTVATLAAGTNFQTQATGLRTARRQACATTAETVPRRGASKRTYVHVMGGVGASGAALTATEVALISDAATNLTFANGSSLVTATSGCAAATLNDEVLVLGENRLQRAKILSALAAPTLVAKVDYATGTLPAGAYSYSVSYTSNADGESLPSNFGEVILAAPGRVTLNFTAPAGVTDIQEWTVYRSNGNVTVQIGSKPTTNALVVDAGTLTTSAGQPRAPGAVGKWSSVAAPLLNTRNAVAFTFANVDETKSIVLYAGGFTGATTNPSGVVARVPVAGAPTAAIPLNITMARHAFARYLEKFDSFTGQPDELWALFSPTDVLSSLPVEEASFDTNIKPTSGVYNVQPHSCAAVGADRIFLVGGDGDVRTATFTRQPSASRAVVGTISQQALAGLPIHEEPACVRVAGKLLLFGGVGNAATQHVTTLIL